MSFLRKKFESSPEYARTGAPSHFEEPPSRELPGPNGSPSADMGPVRTYGRPRRRWHRSRHAPLRPQP